MCAQSLKLYPQLSVTPRTATHQVPLSMRYLSKNNGMGCHFLLQGIFPTQESNPHLLQHLHWQVDSLPLSYLGSPQIVPSIHLLPFDNFRICCDTICFIPDIGDLCPLLFFFCQSCHRFLNLILKMFFDVDHF